VTRAVLIVAAAFLALSAPVATLAKKRTDETAVHVRAAAGANPGQVPALQGSSSATAESGVATDAGGNVWYHVVSSKMPKPQDVEAPKAAAKEAPAPGPPPAGQVIVQFAQAYLGYPYVWAGNGPYGFDCSGFTQFVILNTLGIDIGHAVAGQPYAGGAWVDWGNWLPGDLVFFQNTYAAGISHVGIYIGDGLFIHAENPSTGVTISSVYSDYYAAHYWGSSRLA